MSERRSPDAAPLRCMLCMLAVILLAWPLSAHAGEGEAAAAPDVTVFTPPTASEAYHQHAKDTFTRVLADDEFANLNPTSDRWLREKFEQIADYFRSMRSGIDQMPVWVHKLIIAWMIIALLAVLLHLIYTVWQSLGSPSGERGLSDEPRDKAAPGLLGVRELDFDAVVRRARELFDSGDFRGAVRHYYAAAILLLDRQGRLRFAPAKTNRDYLRELALGDPAHPPLRAMTRQFEATVFGQRATDAQTTHAMAAELDTIRTAPAEPAPASPPSEPMP